MIKRLRAWAVIAAAGRAMHGPSQQRPSWMRSAITSKRVLLLALLPLAACQAKDQSDPLDDGVQHGLGIHSYNYTDQAIESFSVDGTWGGDVRVSTPTAGGGKTTCCMRVPRRLPQTYTVRWAAEACWERVQGDGQLITQYRTGWREKRVVYDGPLPAKPVSFEVHFYPGDDIRIEITDDYTPPRLVLPVDERGRRPGVPDWGECTPEQKRTFTE